MTICPSCGHENNETAKFCEECAAPLVAEAPSREQRKTVTVLFCDVTGSTALGESTRPGGASRRPCPLLRAHEGHRRVARRHGGEVHRRRGDGRLRRAGCTRTTRYGPARGSGDARRAAGARRSQARIGVNTGEVVTGTEERLATGDAVNVAARLEQAAQPGEILIGAETLALVRDAVEVEPVEPLELKGKAEPVAAYRLWPSSATRGAPPTRAPMVGRETRAPRCCADAYEQAVRERSCQLFTLLGAAGVGKSRLAASSSRGLDATRSSAGRCLSYGEGITYWPVVEVRQAARRAARGRRLRRPPRSRRCSARRETATSADEIAWAFRKPLEAAAPSGRSSCVFDDLHWGEHDVPRPRRARRRLAPRRADPAALHGAAGAARPPARLGRREAERDDRSARAAAAPTTDELIAQLLGDVRSPTRCASDPRGRRGQPAVRRGDARDGAELAPTATSPCRRRSRRCSRRGSTSSTPASGRARARRGRGRGLPPRRRPGARAGRGARSPQRLIGLVRKELVRPDRAQLPGRGRVPLPPPPDPRRGLRRAAESGRAPTCTSASRAGWTSAAATSSSSTRSSATTSSRPVATGTSSGFRKRQRSGRLRTGASPPQRERPRPAATIRQAPPSSSAR